MPEFEVDPRLVKDCLVLGTMDISQVLLMNNALLPWFILVPMTSEIEIIDLSASDQARLLEEINVLSHFVKRNFDISKLNIAAIGNIVSQLHIHIVGRDPSDYCWPNVVWGSGQQKQYSPERIRQITTILSEQLADKFLVHEYRNRV